MKFLVLDILVAVSIFQCYFHTYSSLHKYSEKFSQNEQSSCHLFYCGITALILHFAEYRQTSMPIHPLFLLRLFNSEPLAEKQKIVSTLHLNLHFLTIFLPLDIQLLLRYKCSAKISKSFVLKLTIIYHKQIKMLSDFKKKFFQLFSFFFKNYHFLFGVFIFSCYNGVTK